MSNYSRFVVGSLLAASIVAGRGGPAAAQSGAVITPSQGGGAPRVIATSRPVNDVEPAKPAAVLPGHPQEADVPPVTPVARIAPSESHEPPPGALRQVGAAAPHAAPAGACLVVERSAPAQVAEGKLLSYEIVVRNVGAAEAQRVHVEEQLPAGAAVTATEPHAEGRGTLLAWDLGALAAGAESRLRVTMQPPADGDVNATATVTCVVGSALHVRVVRSGVSVTVGDAPPAKVGQKVTFKIQLANNTTAPLSRVLLRAKLSDGLQHPQGQLIEAVIPVLAAGEVKPVPLEVTALKGGRATLTASLTVPGAEPKTAEGAVEITEVAAPAPVPAVVKGSPEVKPAPVVPPAPPPAPPLPKPDKKPTIDPLPAPAPEKDKKSLPAPDMVLPPPPPLDLPLPQTRATPAPSAGKPIASAGGPAVTLDLTDPDAALEVGGETTYEIRVLNQGAAPTRDVLVKAVVPDEMTLVRAEGPGAQPAQVKGKEVAFGPLASLTGQGQAVYRVRVKATKPGDGRFTAHMQAGEMARPLSQEVNTRVYSDDAPAVRVGQK